MGTHDKNHEVIDRLLDSEPDLVHARSSDGRGLAWWAWEFKNVHVLGSIIMNGGDPMSDDEDIDANVASKMCPDPCDQEGLMKQARSLVDVLEKQKQERLARLEEEDEEDEDLADDEF